MMRVLLDTSALNWLADHADSRAKILAAVENGRLEVLVTPEAAVEIRNTEGPERQAALEDVLAAFVPLTKTRVPRLGAFRLGSARVSLPEDSARLAKLAFLKDGQDRNLAANAGGYRCDAFVTCDKEMAVRKRQQLEIVLDGTRVLQPDELLRQLADTDQAT